MLNNLIPIIKCESCGGSLNYSNNGTVEAYTSSATFDIDNIENIVDGIIAEYLVFECSVCGDKYRYTFKEIEKIARKELSRMVMTSVAVGAVIQSGKLNRSDRTLVYCNKCNGVDGKGGCLLKIFKDCKLKRLPSDL
jgi:hypothetical protein